MHYAIYQFIDLVLLLQAANRVLEIISSGMPVAAVRQ
jgi:hypothetical protein